MTLQFSAAENSKITISKGKNYGTYIWPTSTDQNGIHSYWIILKINTLIVQSAESVQNEMLLGSNATVLTTQSEHLWPIHQKTSVDFYGHEVAKYPMQDTYNNSYEMLNHKWENNKVNIERHKNWCQYAIISSVTILLFSTSIFFSNIMYFLTPCGVFFFNHCFSKVSLRLYFYLFFIRSRNVYSQQKSRKRTVHKKLSKGGRWTKFGAFFEVSHWVFKLL